MGGLSWKKVRKKAGGALGAVFPSSLGFDQLGGSFEDDPLGTAISVGTFAAGAATGNPMLMAAGASQFAAGSAAAQNRKAQERIAKQNFELQLKDQRTRQALAQLLRSDQRLGTVDERGNRVFFQPGVGFKTQLSPESRRLQELSDFDATRQLQAAEGGRVRAGEIDRRAAMAGRQGEAELRKLKRPPSASPQFLQSLTRAEQTSQGTESLNNVVQAIARNANRTGRGLGDALEPLNAARVRSLPGPATGQLESIANARALEQGDQKFRSDLVNMLLAQGAGRPVAAAPSVAISGPSGESRLNLLPQAQGMFANLAGAASPQRQFHPVAGYETALGIQGLYEAYAGQKAARDSQMQMEQIFNYLAGRDLPYLRQSYIGGNSSLPPVSDTMGSF